MSDIAPAHVAILISNPSRPALDAALVGGIAAQLPDAGQPRWLAEGVAAEIPCGPVADVAALRRTIGEAPVDVAVLPAAGRRKQLFLADMDSTMIGQECIDELADFAGMKPMVATITERAMRGEIAFEPALRERVALLRGLPVGVVDSVIAERITLTPGATTLVRTMRANGAHTMLVSGGFTVFTSKVAAAIGFHEQRANELLIEDEHFAGTVAEPILGREAKLAALEQLCARHDLPATATMAVGDGANDLAMVQAAGIGVAYHAKPQVAAAAQVRIDHGDLTALLYLQGYSRDAFIER
ncbi:phosphoserine phosphatase SerB [Ancylobacter sp. 6x-1]|uniref:Phosphoserine phosphatase n=1 Tax=Ancylobacter crimeensis TaxID=2579147 RepID=A0ABT0DE87_9HYPH|nr:phosphoserine phosphatase SerB [Ancylobacter crimeensis]MCK0198258.1 phosphoserine phosphatase SerB [Ancylobacter crimeensis]